MIANGLFLRQFDVFGQNVFDMVELCVGNLQQTDVLFAAKFADGHVAFLLVFQRPILVSSEQSDVLIVLLAIIFYYKVMVGQPEVGLQVVALAKHVVVRPDGFLLIAHVVLS